MKCSICLVSITASHYRSNIYQLMEYELGCDFIFGDGKTTIKQLNLNRFINATRTSTKTIYNKWSIMPNLRKKINKYNIIIDDSGIMNLSSWFNLIASRFSKQRVFLWGHGWYGREGFIKKWMKRAYFGLSDGCFIYGNYAKNLMIENGFQRNKLYVIHNSLNYDKQLEQRNSIKPSDIYVKRFNNEYPTLIFIGRLTSVKKLDLLINAVSYLKKQGENYNIVFVGDGDEKVNLENLAIANNMDNQIWFYGACYDETLNAELIYNADLCVAPGNVGLTAMHTMMFGCPVLTHNDFKWQMPEFEAIHEGVTGLFFEYNNINSLANSISDWFKHKQGLREEVRKACYKEIDEEWNPHKQIDVIKQAIGYE